MLMAVGIPFEFDDHDRTIPVDRKDVGNKATFRERKLPYR